MTYIPIEVNEIFIVPDIENLTQKYDTLHDVTNCTDGGSQIILRKIITCRYPTFRTKFNVHTRIPELTPDKVIKLQKNITFCKHILQHIHCSKNDNYFIDAMGILHKKVINFNSAFSAMVVPQILIKYFLHASHNSLWHVGPMKLYHFLKRP